MVQVHHGPPLRASQVHKAELAPGHMLRLQVGGLDHYAHDEVASRGLLVHLGGGDVPRQLTLQASRQGVGVESLQWCAQGGATTTIVTAVVWQAGGRGLRCGVPQRLRKLASGAR